MYVEYIILSIRLWYAICANIEHMVRFHVVKFTILQFHLCEGQLQAQVIFHTFISPVFFKDSESEL